MFADAKGPPALFWPVGEAIKSSLARDRELGSEEVGPGAGTSREGRLGPSNLELFLVDFSG